MRVEHVAADCIDYIIRLIDRIISSVFREVHLCILCPLLESDRSSFSEYTGVTWNWWRDQLSFDLRNVERPCRDAKAHIGADRNRAVAQA